MDWKDLASSLANKGLPVLGRALGTLVGGQIPFFGDKIAGAGESIGEGAAKMLADALGVKPTPEAISNAIENGPTTEIMQKLQSVEVESATKWPAIAAIVQVMGEEYKAALADNDAARAQMIRLAEMSSPMAWAPTILSVVIVFAFTLVMVLWTFTPPRADPTATTILNVLVGTLAAGFGQVISYWLGSSAGSKDKDYALKAALVGAQSNTRQAIVAPATVAASSVKPTTSGKR